MLYKENVSEDRPSVSFLSDPFAEGEEVIGIRDGSTLGLVRQLIGKQTHRGGDLKIISGPNGSRPAEAQPIDAGWWRWRTCVSTPWKFNNSHIN